MLECSVRLRSGLLRSQANLEDYRNYDYIICKQHSQILRR